LFKGLMTIQGEGRAVPVLRSVYSSGRFNEVRKAFSKYSINSLYAMGVGRGADMSLTGFHLSWIRFSHKTYRPSPTKDVT
jgi:hypothetical protein